MSGQPAQTLATHLLNQTLSSIAILETLNVINASDAHLIRSKLPSPTGPFPSLTAPLPAPAPQDLAQSFGGLSVNPTNAYAQNQPTSPQQHYQSPTHSFQPPPAPAPPSLPPRARSEQRAKALWDYSGAVGWVMPGNLLRRRSLMIWRLDRATRSLLTRRVGRRL